MELSVSLGVGLQSARREDLLLLLLLLLLLCEYLFSNVMYNIL
jgi:hypothetical protein